MRSRLGSILCVFSLLVALAGCGSSDGGGTAPPPTSNPPPQPPPPPPPPPPVIGADGGTATEASGASVIVPAGALTAATTIRVAMDSTGAPALPTDLTGAGNIYVITPHGGDFAQPVEVRIPAPTVTLLPTQELKLAKAQPNGEWVVLDDSVLDAGVLSADVSSFSFFMPVIINYVLPLAQREPIRVTASLNCGGSSCGRAFGAVTATYTVTSNNGQFPEGCSDGSLRIFTGVSLNYSSTLGSLALESTGGSLTRTINPSPATQYRFGVGRRCTNSWSSYGYGLEKSITWVRPPEYPNLAILDMPTQVDIVEGLPANVDVVFGGGASRFTTEYSAATIDDRAIIDWQRSDDNGASWRVIANSYQNEANPLPYGVGMAWRYWRVRHGFIATATDQGALIRVHACYTPQDVPAPPCVYSSATRINVLQQSALPAIVDAPRSVLVRTGQTASLTATASGAPAPTLQWQTRAANSTDAWSDVTTGTGPTTANYTTTATTLADNGVQYRVVATNAVGSTESTAVTVSVSDVDVAPSITTQPANLSVASGSDAVFAIDARGTEALSYQWRRNGVAIAGANSPVLRLTGVTPSNAGAYSVTVGNSAGDADSNAATLTVVPGVPADVAPTIITQPAAVTVNVGNTATFAVGVDGSGPFSFQWRRDGVNIPGSASAVLTLNAVTNGSAGSYSVVVSNAASPGGVTSSAATLTVNTGGAVSAPTITSQPSTVIIAPGGSGLLAVAATGSGPLSYQWRLDGVDILGQNTAVLPLANVDASDVGDYTVVVSNSVGQDISEPAQMILLGAPFITQSPVSRTVPDGDTTTFSVIAGGSGLRYQWLRNGLAISGATQSYYTSPPVFVADSGAVYSVIVSNGAGIELSASAVLTVVAFTPPSVIQHPVSTSVTDGSAAPLCATFGGTPPFEVQMTRWSGTAWLPVLAARRIDDNLPACTVTPVLQLADSGVQFRFEAISGPGQAFGVVTNPATITVTAPPAITSTTLVSRATSGATANNRSHSPSLSADGNLVAFISDGTNLVPNFNGDAFTAQYAYVRNLSTGTTTLINQTPAGNRSSTGVNGLKLAAGGRYAIFSSLASDLVADDTNGSQDVFVRDLQTGTTTRVSLRADGTESEPSGNGQSDMQLNISADGRWVSFVSSLDLIGNDPPGTYALYLRSLQSGFLRRVAGYSTSLIAYSTMSGNGEHMAYMYGTFAPAPARNIIVYYDVEANSSSEAFSIDSSGADYIGQGLSISGNGRYLAFALRSQPLLGSTYPQVVAIDRTAPNTLMLASTGSAGSGIGIGNHQSSYPMLSDDGRYLLFSTMAGNITENVAWQSSPVMLVRDLQAQTTSIAFRRFNGSPARSGAYNSHAISLDGRMLADAAGESEVTGAGAPDYQVFMAPRPD